MTFDEFWNRLVEKNPHLSNENTVMKITVASFRKSVKQAFEMGKPANAPTQGSVIDDLMGYFGGKR